MIKMSETEKIKKIEMPAQTVYECETCHTQYRIENDALRCASMEVDPLKPGFVYGIDGDPFCQAGIVFPVSNEVYPAGLRGNLHTRRVYLQEYLFFPEDMGVPKRFRDLFRFGRHKTYNSEIFRGKFERGRYHVLTEEQRELFLTLIHLEQDMDHSYFREIAEFISNDRDKKLEDVLYIEYEEEVE